MKVGSDDFRQRFYNHAQKSRDANWSEGIRDPRRCRRLKTFWMHPQNHYNRVGRNIRKSTRCRWWFSTQRSDCFSHYALPMKRINKIYKSWLTLCVMIWVCLALRTRKQRKYRWTCVKYQKVVTMARLAQPIFARPSSITMMHSNIFLYRWNLDYLIR